MLRTSGSIGRWGSSVSETDHTVYQIADQMKAVLEAYEPLADWRVVVGQSEDIAEEDTEQTIIIGIVTTETDSAVFSSGNTEHVATIETEAVSNKDANGTLSRLNMTALAHINAAILADHASGSRVVQAFDIVPIDAGTPANGLDVTSASLQWRVEWVTPRDDWTTFSPN